MSETATINWSAGADFFLAGLLVAWPMLLWSGYFETGLAVYIALFLALVGCAMMVDAPAQELS